MKSTIPLLAAILLSLTLLGVFPTTVSGQCIADSTINDFFIPENESQIPVEGSCCQADVCGLGCPEEVPAPAGGKLLMVWYKKKARSS